MTSDKELDAGERKRQREALRRRMKKGGLRPGLLQKYNAAVTDSDKWALLKAFMLDPDNMEGVEVEAIYADQAVKEESDNWAELPLCQLRKIYTTETEKKFLQKIVDEQEGTPHPQDPKNPEMRRYWHWKESTENNGRKRCVGTHMYAKHTVPANKAARQMLSDGLDANEADFAKGASKGSRKDPEPAAPSKRRSKKAVADEEVPETSEKQPKTGSSKGGAKGKKARAVQVSCLSRYSFLFHFLCLFGRS